MTSSTLSTRRHNAVIYIRDNPPDTATGAIMAKRWDADSRRDASASRYDDELLCANWNPVIDLLHSSVDMTAGGTSRRTHGEVSEEDAAEFLGRIYTFGA